MKPIGSSRERCFLAPSPAFAGEGGVGAPLGDSDLSAASSAEASGDGVCSFPPLRSSASVDMIRTLETLGWVGAIAYGGRDDADKD